MGGCLILDHREYWANMLTTQGHRYARNARIRCSVYQALFCLRSCFEVANLPLCPRKQSCSLVDLSPSHDRGQRPPQRIRFRTHRASCTVCVCAWDLCSGAATYGPSMAGRWLVDGPPIHAVLISRKCCSLPPALRFPPPCSQAHPPCPHTYLQPPPAALFRFSNLAPRSSRSPPQSPAPRAVLLGLPSLRA